MRGLDDAQLDTPYRPGGWTVRQTVHHVADSHMNSFIRLRLALTEPEPDDHAPTIRRPGANSPIRAPPRWSFPCNSLKTFTPAGCCC